MASIKFRHVRFGMRTTTVRSIKALPQGKAAQFVLSIQDSIKITRISKA
jgi:hypothetical protein